MNRIHKKTMTDEEREENEQKYSALSDRYFELDSDNDKDRKERERIEKEESDLGYSDASSSLAQSIEDKALAEEYRKRSFFQLKMEYDRGKSDKEDKAKALYDHLRKDNRLEEAITWFVRFLRYGGLVHANGDKKLLRDMLDVNYFDDEEDDLHLRYEVRSLEYLNKTLDDSLKMMVETERESKITQPDILLCGPDRSACQSLLEWILPRGAEPIVMDGPNDGSGDADDDASKKLIYRISDYSFANIIEAKTIFGFKPELTLSPGKTMKEFVRDIERERPVFGVEDDSELTWGDRIDAVWYVTDGNRDMIDDREREFIRSMMELPNAMLVVNLSFTVLSRDYLPPVIDALTDLVDPDRIVLVDSGYYGQEIDARWHLLEATKQKHKESRVFLSDEERQKLEDAWAECFGELLPKWRARSEQNVERCIRHAAGRARFIVEQGADTGLFDLLEDGVARLKDLLGLIRGSGNDAEVERELKKDVFHTAELLGNITVMIYELGGCCGCLAVPADVTMILSACQASDLPEDAAAITYAVGMAAKAYFESGKEISREELKAVFAKAKEEGLRLSFEPMHEDDPATSDLFDDLEDEFAEEFGGDDENEDDGGDDDDNGGGDDDDNDGGDDGNDDDDDGGMDGGGDKLCFFSDISLLKSVWPGSLSNHENKLDDLLSKLTGNGGEVEDEPVDSGDGCVMSASGGGPEFRNNASGKLFRLPDDYPAPRDVLKTNALGGGWGYAMRDAAVIQGGISTENAFIEVRIREELRRLEKAAGAKLVFADYQNYAHELVCEGDDFYDLLYVQVEVIPEEDWEQLKADWESHDGYKKDKAGRRKHEEWRESRTIRFTEHFWFNVNAMFNFDDEDDGSPDGDA